MTQMEQDAYMDGYEVNKRIVGGRIRTLHKKMNLDQNALSEMLNISRLKLAIAEEGGDCENLARIADESIKGFGDIMLRRYKTIDLFSGCGGMSLGFQNAGFDIVAAYDNWDPAVNIYRHNFTHPIYKADLNEETPIQQIEELHPDIIIGGPPCQDFSIAGHRNMGERANLTIRYAEIISKLKPKWFVMENVYNIERMPVLPKATKIIKDAGYGITTRILNASYCGVPQARMRFFMVGHLGDKDGFLGELLDARQSEKPMTVYDYLGDSLHTEYYYMHPRSYNRRAVFSIHEPSATIRGVNRPVPDGYKRHHADKADISDGVRALTSKERSYIQTFPESFVFEGKKTDVEQAIGNAVPVKLAEYVAKCVLEYVQKEGAPSV